MSLKKLFVYLLFVFLSLNIYSQTAELKGNDLCNYLYDYLSANQLQTRKQEFISSTDNFFPYNIIVDFESLTQPSEDRLIISVKMTDAFLNMDIIENIITDLKFRNYNATLVFIYGADKSIPRRRISNGSDVFAQSLNTNDNNIVFNLGFSAESNSVITGTFGVSAPSWMIKNAFDAYISQNLTDDLPLYYLSQLSKFQTARDTIFSTFANNSIPVISANFNGKTTDHEVISNVISHFIDNFESSKNLDCDYHSLMFRFSTKTIWISEYTIVRIILVLLFISIMYIFITGFVNANLRNKAWFEIKRNWYSLPITYGLLVLGFYAGKFLFQLFNKNVSDLHSTFSVQVIQIIVSTLFISIFYYLQTILHKKKYDEHSVDYLFIFATFLNQFIFALIDISLFPLFFVICVISIIALSLHKNWIHILLLIFMIGIYIPYIINLYNFADSNSLVSIMYRNSSINYVLPLILLPAYIMWFRILTAIKKRFANPRMFMLIIGLNYLAVILVLILVNLFVFKNNTETNNARITNDDKNIQNYMAVTYKDRLIFGETIRTIYMDTFEQADYISITISSEESLPVLYSDNDYTSNSKTSCSFRIPSDPPSKLKFSYGAAKVPCTITAEALFKEQDQYISRKIILQTEAN